MSLLPSGPEVCQRNASFFGNESEYRSVDYYEAAPTLVGVQALFDSLLILFVLAIRYIVCG